MKTRLDFVSNSSSTSFILNAEDINSSIVDLRFLELIGNCVTLYFNSKAEEYSESILKEAKDHFENACTYAEDNTIEVELKDISLATKPTLKVFLDILQETSVITCSYGCDDCGDFVGEATQVCTMLELLYDVLPEGDDHFLYDSVKRLKGAERK